MESAKHAIDELTHAFFGAFTNRNGAEPNVDGIRDLFVPNGIVVKSIAGKAPEVWTVDAFIQPRKALLASGALTDFSEEEISERTEISFAALGNIAQRSSMYRKTGLLDGARFEGRGVKLFQYALTPAGWRISAVAWEDEARA
jgi:hypothetical protein